MQTAAFEIGPPALSASLVEVRESFHGSFHRFRWSVHGSGGIFHGNVEASAEVTSEEVFRGRFHGSFRGSNLLSLKILRKLSRKLSWK